MTNLTAQEREKVAAAEQLDLEQPADHPNKKSTLSQDRYRTALAGLKPLLQMLVIGER